MKLGWLFGLLALFAAASGSAGFRSAEPFQPRAVAWEGKGIVYAGDRKIEIGVRTRISKEGHVVSESWPLAQGEGAMRRMIIDDRGGWMERDGKREPMPKEMLEHERQQFDFYRSLQSVMAARSRPHEIAIPPAGATFFMFNQDGWPAEARNRVVSPEPGGPPIEQHFFLSGETISNGVGWPRQIRILHNGKPYFTLNIEKFEAGAAP